MTFYNNNLFSNLPCPDWMQNPLQISEGGSPKRDEHFSITWRSAMQIYWNKESFKWQKCSSPTGMVWNTKMAIVSLFWDTKGAFDWQIWI